MDQQFERWWDEHGQGSYFGGLTEPVQLKNVAWQAWCAARALPICIAQDEGDDDNQGEHDGPVQCEGYPPNWMHATIHLNSETGEMHSDGDHRVRRWLEANLKDK